MDERTKRADRLRRLYEVIWELSHERGEPASFEDIIEELVRKNLEELVALGLVEKVGDDRYQAVR